MEKKRIAIVLFNLGGPDKGESVQPFLFNLFNDKAIIGVPQPMRYLLAKFISTRRAPVAREIYDHIGGGSPLLANTEAQADALTEGLQDLGEVKCFLAMRYWHPLTAAAIQQVKAFQPDEIVLLPLYPQFSTTTTGSSLEAWQKASVKAGLTAPVRTVCCYPDEPGFIDQSAQQISETLAAIKGDAPIRVLFSAHGLPKRIVEGGDPYQYQVEQTASAIAQKLVDQRVDTLVCYQSKVGPLEWIGPSTEDEIERAGSEKTRLVIFPLAFVSEHSETLVELDIEYREIAEASGVEEYHRVPTVGTGEAFIDGLNKVVRGALNRETGLAADGGKRFCPGNWTKCPCHPAAGQP